MNNVISTKISIFRNLKDYKFVKKLTEANKQEIRSKVEAVLGKDFSTKDNIHYINSQNVTLTLFEGEHVTISYSTQDYNEKELLKVNEIKDKLSNALTMAYSDDYGYLMSDLTKIGSGIRLTSKINLYGVNTMEKADQLQRNLAKLGYSLQRTDVKDVFVLNSVCVLGLTENEILLDFKNTLNKIQDLEIECLKMLDVNNHDEFINQAFRSLALLKSSYLMPYDELNKHISNLIVGNNLGITNISNAVINQLQNLVNEQKEFISQTELKQIARKVQDILKGE